MKRKHSLFAILLFISTSLSVNSQSWNLTGNSGITPSTNFVGTTDSKSLRFRTNNIQRMIIDSLGVVTISNVSSPGTGTASERFGASSSTGTSVYSTAIGYGASIANGNDYAVAIGANSVAGYSSTTIGWNSSSNGHSYTTLIGGNLQASSDHNMLAGNSIGSVGYTGVGYAIDGGTVSVGALLYSHSYGNVYMYGSQLDATADKQLLFGGGFTGTWPTDVWIGPPGGNSYASTYGPLTYHAINGQGTNVQGQGLTFSAGRGTGSGTGGAIKFYTTSAGTSGTTLNTEVLRMIVDQSGKVGIGTSDFSDNNFKLFVETGIRTRKVKVDQSSWADYVFHNDYKLRPLAEVERFIKVNSHLPEVPSAEEVEENGVDLGENQVILLKKVEELTLYIIEQNRQIEEMKKEIECLKIKCSKIKK